MDNTLNNLKALASDRRLEIVNMLRSKEYEVNEIAKHLGISGNTASYHLRILAREEYVCARKQGKYSYYSLTTHLYGKKLLLRVDK